MGLLPPHDSRVSPPTGFSSCQKCPEGQWSPAGSELCLDRTLEFLAWDGRVSLVLLFCMSLLMMMMAGTGALFLGHLHTPVVRSAGGCLAVVMLGSLACAGLSLYAAFGVPSPLTCLLRSPLYNVSCTLCLACMVARSFQIVIIFKAATRAPALLEGWRKRHGAGALIFGLTAVQGAITAMHLSVRPPAPQKDYKAYGNVTVLECSRGDPALYLSGTLYNALLGVACFAVSYLGKDLPSSYNEAKCLAFSLLIYFACLVSEFVAQNLYAGRDLAAVFVAAHLANLSGIFGNYFLPKAYVILFHSERNTCEHFQRSIQSYTQRANAAG